jgi:hypothetical protein
MLQALVIPNYEFNLSISRYQEKEYFQQVANCVPTRCAVPWDDMSFQCVLLLPFVLLLDWHPILHVHPHAYIPLSDVYTTAIASSRAQASVAGS